VCRCGCSWKGLLLEAMSMVCGVDWYVVGEVGGGIEAGEYYLQRPERPALYQRPQQCNVSLQHVSEPQARSRTSIL
jgi:hypothetical protein